MKKVHIGDLRLEQDETEALLAVIRSGRISEGKKVQEFERLFAGYVGRKYCVAVNSGTSALLAGLLALLNDERYPRIKKGAKVITTPLTYAATSNAIVMAGLEPVYADIRPDGFNIDCDCIIKLLESSGSEDYCMILPVHLMGVPCEMDRINEIAEKYGLFVFEDAAQAHGSIYKGRRAGSLSLLSAFSFYIAHNIQAGELGAVVTDDEGIYRKLISIKANGRVCDCSVCTRMNGFCRHESDAPDEWDADPRFKHKYIGLNMKTMEFPAALAVTQISKAEDNLWRRQENVRLMNERLAIYSQVFRLPEYNKDYSYLGYALVVKEGAGFGRKDIRSFLESRGIENRPLFGCIPTRQPAYSYLKDKYLGLLPNAEYAGDNGFYTGCHQYMEVEDINCICDVFDEFMEERYGYKG